MMQQSKFSEDNKVKETGMDSCSVLDDSLLESLSNNRLAEKILDAVRLAVARDMYHRAQRYQTKDNQFHQVRTNQFTVEAENSTYNHTGSSGDLDRQSLKG